MKHALHEISSLNKVTSKDSVFILSIILPPKLSSVRLQ